jgi:hypothetical protein
MRIYAFASLAITLGCSSSSSTSGTGSIDPAAQDFCLQWANDVCRLAYLCVDAASQDAAFHARYGTSLDNCWNGIEKLCTSNQSGSQTFGPSCGPGKKVDTTTAQACSDTLAAESCTEWTAAPAGACGGVCSASNSGGTGGSGATGTGTGGATTVGGSGSVATAVEYCSTSGNLTCDRAFECESAAATSQFGNLAGCKSLISAACGASDPCPSGYNATLGSACIAATKAATCQDLMGPAPDVCTSACP